MIVDGLVGEFIKTRSLFFTLEINASQKQGNEFLKRSLNGFNK